MLPGINGHELLKELRKIHDTPVLMMTSLDDDENEIWAFTNEVDDYVTKPFTAFYRCIVPIHSIINSCKEFFKSQWVNIQQIDFQLRYYHVFIAVGTAPEDIAPAGIAVGTAPVYIVVAGIAPADTAAGTVAGIAVTAADTSVDTAACNS